jgi:hypothetical protein
VVIGDYMPGVSVSTITRTQQRIGMGIILHTVSDSADHSKKEYLADSHDAECTCCCCYTYEPDKGDIDKTKEEELILQYPNFGSQIHQLLEARRARALEHAPDKKGCSLL